MRRSLVAALLSLALVPGAVRAQERPLDVVDPWEDQSVARFDASDPWQEPAQIAVLDVTDPWDAEPAGAVREVELFPADPWAPEVPTAVFPPAELEAAVPTARFPLEP